jgi:hypothetical protein
MVVVAMMMNISPVKRSADRGGAAEYGRLVRGGVKARQGDDYHAQHNPSILSHLWTLFQRMICHAPEVGENPGRNINTD